MTWIGWGAIIGYCMASCILLAINWKEEGPYDAFDVWIIGVLGPMIVIFGVISLMLIRFFTEGRDVEDVQRILEENEEVEND